MKQHKGIDYIVLITPRLGNFVAYIRLPDELEKTINVDEIECHGGVTFNAVVTKEDEGKWFQEFSPGHWIGWDYAHAGDEIPAMRFRFPDLHDRSEKLWQPEEVEKEVLRVIDSLVTH